MSARAASAGRAGISSLSRHSCRFLGWLVFLVLFSFHICFYNSQLIKMLGAKGKESIPWIQFWLCEESSVRTKTTLPWEFSPNPTAGALFQPKKPACLASPVARLCLGIWDSTCPGGKAIRKWLKETAGLLEGHWDMGMGYGLSGRGLAWGQGFHGSWIALTFKIKWQVDFFYGPWPALELGKAHKTTVGKSYRRQWRAASQLRLSRETVAKMPWALMCHLEPSQTGLGPQERWGAFPDPD